MKQFACRYAVVQFTPYSETGEFANVGVVLMCPATKQFGFLLQTRKYKRVTDFFDELPRDVYLRSMQVIKRELERVADMVRAAPESGQVEYLRRVFEDLVHPREAIVRFSQARVVLTDDPDAELKRQFDHYVDRSFATPEYVEQAIEKRIRSLLNTLELKQPFKPEKVGEGDVFVRFPLVQKRGSEVAKIIKPFNLNQKETMAIYDHGSTWVQRVKLLRRHGLLPDAVLFAVSGPPESDFKRHEAFVEMRRELEAEDVQLVSEAAETRIAEFALGGAA